MRACKPARSAPIEITRSPENGTGFERCARLFALIRELEKEGGGGNGNQSNRSTKDLSSRRPTPVSSPSRPAFALPTPRNASMRERIATFGFVSTRGTLPTRNRRNVLPSHSRNFPFSFAAPPNHHSSESTWSLDAAPPRKRRLSLLLGADGCRGTSSSPPLPSSSSSVFAGSELDAAAEAGEYCSSFFSSS